MEQSSETIEITVNGQPTRVGRSATVTQALEQLGIPSTRVAVERNRELVRRSDWDRVTLEPEDILEIVEFVGGG